MMMMMILMMMMMRAGGDARPGGVGRWHVVREGGNRGVVDEKRHVSRHWEAVSETKECFIAQQ